MPNRPVFLLAFAWDPTAALPEIIHELKTIERLLTATEATVITLWQATQADLETHFDRYRDEIRLFHFSGHAGPNALHLNSPDGKARSSFADGLAGLAGMAPGLRLVFLNGCSTEGQAAAFLNRGIGAVISTSQPLLDRFGLDFARRFYQGFTRANSRLTLKQGFEAAWYSFLAEQGNPTESMLDETIRQAGSVFDEDSDEPLYELKINEKKPNIAAERFADWHKLAEPAGPDPAVLKKEIQDLVVQARMEEALVKLVDAIALLKRDHLQHTALMLRGQFANFQREKISGILSSGEANIGFAKITQAALELARQL